MKQEQQIGKAKTRQTSMPNLRCSSQIPMNPAPTATRMHKLGNSLPAAPSFQPLPSSSLATGEPIADISAGWDGTLWAVDSLGIPHVYDPLQQSWQTYGKGVDAAAKWGDALYLFSGADVAIYDLATSQVTLQTIATLWPDLPPSFTSHLDGASCMGGQLVLFRGGRCVAVANPAAVQTLSELEFWPSQWADGVVHAVAGVEPFDGVYQFGFPFFWPPGDTTAPVITCVCYEDAQFGVLSALEKDFSRLPLHSALRDVLEQRFDAYIEYHDVDPSAQGLVFQGPVVWKASSTQPITACPLGSFVPLDYADDSANRTATP